MLPGMPQLFSYGTLQREDVQLSTFGRLLRGHADALPGFTTSLVRIEDPDEAAAAGRTHYDNVVRDARPGSAVAGTLFEITDAELIAADGYERSASYERVTVVLASGQQAWVYVHTGG